MTIIIAERFSEVNCFHCNSGVRRRFAHALDEFWVTILSVVSQLPIFENFKHKQTVHHKSEPNANHTQVIEQRSVSIQRSHGEEDARKLCLLSPTLRFPGFCSRRGTHLKLRISRLSLIPVERILHFDDPREGVFGFCIWATK